MLRCRDERILNAKVGAYVRSMPWNRRLRLSAVADATLTAMFGDTDSRSGCSPGGDRQSLSATAAVGFRLNVELCE
jgi:hypothetical protein